MALKIQVVIWDRHKCVTVFVLSKTLEKTEGEIKNGKSSDTDNTGTRHRMKKNSTKTNTSHIH